MTCRISTEKFSETPLEPPPDPSSVTADVLGSYSDDEPVETKCQKQVCAERQRKKTGAQDASVISRSESRWIPLAARAHLQALQKYDPEHIEIGLNLAREGKLDHLKALQKYPNSVVTRWLKSPNLKENPENSVPASALAEISHRDSYASSFHSSLDPRRNSGSSANTQYSCQSETTSPIHVAANSSRFPPRKSSRAHPEIKLPTAFQPTLEIPPISSTRGPLIQDAKSSRPVSKALPSLPCDALPIVEDLREDASHVLPKSAARLTTTPAKPLSNAEPVTQAQPKLVVNPARKFIQVDTARPDSSVLGDILLPLQTSKLVKRASSVPHRPSPVASANTSSGPGQRTMAKTKPLINSLDNRNQPAENEISWEVLIGSADPPDGLASLHTFRSRLDNPKANLSRSKSSPGGITSLAAVDLKREVAATEEALELFLSEAGVEPGSRVSFMQIE
ncbi:hypothetical protein EJ08DRAFT_682914 [Tothia fuscella]|uniref:Uncharacterized protein n=1 Tax=Tothia fuscella TaxID=1048955 RepID=A0A9P4NHE5_9PEZI|nr:hypothetical protein EJ08DRAFT_682914 [Tothia fuscella]